MFRFIRLFALLFFSFVRYIYAVHDCVFLLYLFGFAFVFAGYQLGIEAYVVLCNAPGDMDSGNFGDSRTNRYTYRTYAGSVVLLAKLCSIR